MYCNAKEFYRIMKKQQKKRKALQPRNFNGYKAFCYLFEITQKRRYLVGVTGLEPMASWSRTKRDTKLRHTPMTAIILYNEKLKKSREKSNYFNFKHYLSKSSYTVSEKKEF